MRRTTTVAYRNTVSPDQKTRTVPSELGDGKGEWTVRKVAVLSWGLKRGGGPTLV
jgi:hypothetical protein